MSPIDKVSSIWSTIKALPYDDGPSSSRWGFLVAVHTCCFCLLLQVVVFSIVYLRSARSPADTAFAAIFAGVITAFMGVVVGFTTNTMNLKHTLAANLQAQSTGASDAGVVANTPASTSATETK